MKIVHITKYLPHFAGGIERVTRILAQAGHSAGSEVEIIGIEPRRSECLIQEIGDSKIHRVGVSGRYFNVPVSLGYFSIWKKLASANLIHIHLPNPTAELALLTIAYFLGRRCPPIVPIIHAPIVRFPRIARVWGWLVQKRLLALADSIIVSNINLLKCFPQYREIFDRKKVHVLPFGIPESESAVRRTAHTRERFKILCVGRLVKYKGFDVLLDAVSKLAGDWELTIVGQGPEAAMLKNKVRWLRLSERVKFVEGAREKLRKNLLDDCDLFVLPSQTIAETFGLAIGEAFAHGKPVVTTDIPTGVAFLARMGECGAVVPTNSVEGLRYAIATLMQDESLRDACGRRNYEFWKNELSISRFERNYHGVLQFTRKARASIRLEHLHDVADSAA